MSERAQVFALFAALAILALGELPRYGNAYDSIFGFPQGEALLQRIVTGRDRWTPDEAARCPFRIVDFADLPANVDRFPIDHGQFPTTVSAASCRLFHQRLGMLGVVDAHNLPILVGALGVLALVYALTRRSAGHVAGLWAVMLSASHPRYVVDGFVNYKDLSVTLFLLAVGLIAVRARERPRAVETLAGCVALGLGMASKVSMALGLGALALWAAFDARHVWRKQLAWLALGFAIACGIVWMFWPYLRTPPFGEHFAALSSRLFAHASTERVGGNWKSHLVETHALRYFVIASPELFLVCAVAGSWLVLRGWREPRMAAARLALVVAAVFLGVFSAPGVFVTDGLRYVLPAIPCLAIVGGVFLARAGAWMSGATRPAFAHGLGILVIALSAVPVLSTHPFEITYFNWTSGGLAAARANGLPGASDYWAISYRQVVRWLDQYAEPGALLHTPFAPHLVATNDELRPDLALVRPDVDWCALEPKTAYIFYVTREDLYWQNPIFELAEKNLSPLDTIVSQGVPIVKIYREPTTRICELVRAARGTT